MKIISVDINAINITEDREQFRVLMNEIGIGMAPSQTATSYLKGKEIAQKFGFPLCIRPSFTLGGSGASCLEQRRIRRPAEKRFGVFAHPRGDDRQGAAGLEGI